MSKRDALIRLALEDIDTLVREAEAGALTPAQFRRDMREIIEDTNFAAVKDAAGARRLREMPDATLTALDKHLDGQLRYLDGFAAEWERTGKWKPAYGARARMYAGSVRTADGIGRGVVAGRAVELPAQPGQGSPCMGNCRCRWERVDVDPAAGVYEFYWRRSAAESCTTCVERERQYNPLVVWGWEAVNA